MLREMLCRYLSSACVFLVSRLLRVWLSADPVPTGDWSRSATGMRPATALGAAQPSSAVLPWTSARTGGLVEFFGRRVVGDAAWRRHEVRVRGVGGDRGCGESTESGRGGRPGFPDTGQPGDNRGAAAADDQGEPGDTVDHGSVSRGAAARAAPRPTALVRHPPGNRGRLHQLARAPAASILLACVTR